MSIAVTASERLRRLLALVPWVASQSDGAPIDEICERFGLTRSQVLADLDVIMMVGVHPFTPDALIDVWIEDDIVSIRYADYFARPLQMTPIEGLGLLAACQGLLGAPGSEPDGPLARAVEKLSAVIGPGADQVVDVDLGPAARDVFETLEEARQSRRQVEIDYYSFDRDIRQTRTIEPAHLWSAAGHWYVSGWCHRASGERIFRLDRIAEVELTAKPFEHEPSQDEPGVSFSGDGVGEVVLEVDVTALWLFEGVPHQVSRSASDGRVEIVLATASPVWLQRILLQLGESATVVRADPRFGDEALVVRAARRVLERYEPLGTVAQQVNG